MIVKNSAIFVSFLFTLLFNYSAMADTVIYVNRAEHTLSIVKDDIQIKSYEVITGKPETPTPSFETTFNSIDINPTWRLTENEKRLLKIHPDNVDFYGIVNHSYSPPGPKNPLGKARLNLMYYKPIKIHGTSEPELFKTKKRNYSSGCIRVLEIKDLVEQIVDKPIDWNRNYTIKLKQTIHVIVE